MDRLQTDSPEEIEQGEKLPEKPWTVENFLDFFKKKTKPQEGKKLCYMNKHLFF